MTTRPVRSIIEDQLDDLVMPAGADIAAVLGLPRETLVVNLPRRMALTIKRGRKCLGCADDHRQGSRRSRRSRPGPVLPGLRLHNAGGRPEGR